MHPPSKNCRKISFPVYQSHAAHARLHPEIQSRYLELSTERVEQRVARVLVRLAAQTGIKSPQARSS